MPVGPFEIHWAVVLLTTCLIALLPLPENLPPTSWWSSILGPRMRHMDWDLPTDLPTWKQEINAYYWTPLGCVVCSLHCQRWQMHEQVTQGFWWLAIRWLSSQSCYGSCVGQLQFYSTCLCSQIQDEGTAPLSNTVDRMDEGEKNMVHWL